MLKSCVVDPLMCRVSAKFTETLTLGDIQLYDTQLRADERFSPRYSEIVDLTQVEIIAVSGREVMNLRNEIPFSPRSKRALVVSNRHQSHAAHLYRIIRKGTNIRVFRTFDDAIEWIDKPCAVASFRNRR
jgi:hypothetical protein